MVSAVSPRPALWRTRRPIANHTRLRNFSLHAQQPGQTVSAVVAQVQQPVPIASDYLRALEARGLLTARRASQRVEYRPSPAVGGSRARGSVAAMRSAFDEDPQPTQTLFKVAAAFTHPRRIEIFRALHTTRRTFGELQEATGISRQALRRHLCKLEARGFVLMSVSTAWRDVLTTLAANWSASRLGSDQVVASHFAKCDATTFASLHRC